MKTVSMLAYSGGNREIGIHDVEPELFEKLRPVFAAGCRDDVGRICFDKDTSILLFLKTEETAAEKEASNEGTMADVESEKPFC